MEEASRVKEGQPNVIEEQILKFVALNLQISKASIQKLAEFVHVESETTVIVQYHPLALKYHETVAEKKYSSN